MEHHFHWGIGNVIFFAFTTFAVAHLMRMAGAKIGGNPGATIGGFFTLGS